MSRKKRKKRSKSPQRGSCHSCQAGNERNEHPRQSVKETLVSILAMRELRAVWLALAAVAFLFAYAAISSLLPRSVARISAQVLLVGVALAFGRLIYRSLVRIEEEERKLKEEMETNDEGKED